MFLSQPVRIDGGFTQLKTAIQVKICECMEGVDCPITGLKFPNLFFSFLTNKNLDVMVV